MNDPAAKANGERASCSGSVGRAPGSASATAVGQAVHEGKGASLGRFTATATVDIRRNLSVQMLTAARKAARRVFDAEEANKQAELGAWFDDILIDVPIAVVMSAASIEACANEMIKNLLDDPEGHDLSEARVQLLTDVVERRAGNPKEKFEQVALILDHHLDTGVHQWDDLRLLQSLRSIFMHFKPIWDSEPIPSEKAFRAIVQRVGDICRFFPKEYPYMVYTYRVARWAVCTVPAFTAHFSAQTGLVDILGRENLDFSLPDPLP